MNIQIFGKKKCFDTKKAERYFKERRIKFQKIDLMNKGISLGEVKSVVQSLGLDQIIDESSPYYDESLYPYTSDYDRKLEIITEYPELLKTPIVRNGKKATVGYAIETWKSWE